MDLRMNMKPEVADVSNIADVSNVAKEEKETQLKEELIQKSLEQISKSAHFFIEGTETNGTLLVKEYELLSESLLISSLDGFEFFCMGEEFEYTEKWAPEYFGLCMNYLIAEYMGRGKTCTTDEWIKATERAINALTYDGYMKHKRVTPDIIRSYLNNLDNFSDVKMNNMNEINMK